MRHLAKRAALAVTLTAILTLAVADAASAAPRAARSGGDPSTEHMSAARAAAIHECSVLADKYLDYVWGVQEIDHYRACMAGHGQME
jgi:hypothetical protein